MAMVGRRKLRCGCQEEAIPVLAALRQHLYARDVAESLKKTIEEQDPGTRPVIESLCWIHLRLVGGRLLLKCGPRTRKQDLQAEVKRHVAHGADGARKADNPPHGKADWIQELLRAFEGADRPPLHAHRDLAYILWVLGQAIDPAQEAKVFFEQPDESLKTVSIPRLTKQPTDLASEKQRKETLIRFGIGALLRTLVHVLLLTQSDRMRFYTLGCRLGVGDAGDGGDDWARLSREGFPKRSAALLRLKAKGHTRGLIAQLTPSRDRRRSSADDIDTSLPATPVEPQRRTHGRPRRRLEPNPAGASAERAECMEARRPRGQANRARRRRPGRQTSPSPNDWALDDQLVAQLTHIATHLQENLKRFKPEDEAVAAVQVLNDDIVSRHSDNTITQKLTRAIRENDPDGLPDDEWDLAFAERVLQQYLEE